MSSINSPEHIEYLANLSAEFALQSANKNTQIHIFFKDDAFADLVLHHAKLLLYSRDNAHAPKLGLLNAGVLRIIESQPSSPLCLYALTWLAKICMVNKSLYKNIYGRFGNKDDVGIDYVQSYVHDRLRDVVIESTDILRDVYSILQCYCKFAIQTADVHNQDWVDYTQNFIIKDGNKVRVDMNAIAKRFDSIYPKTIELTDISNLTNLDLLYIVIRDLALRRM